MLKDYEVGSALQNRHFGCRACRVRRFRIRLHCDVHQAYFLLSRFLGKGCLSQDRTIFLVGAVEKVNCATEKKSYGASLRREPKGAVATWERY